MAELKKAQEYLYDLPEVENQQESQTSDSVPSSTEFYPQAASKHLKQVSTLEKMIVGLFILSVIALSALTVMLRTNISSAEKSITNIQTEINEKKQETNRLEQEKHELSRADRVKKIAEEKGLSINDDNLRKVK